MNQVQLEVLLQPIVDEHTKPQLVPENPTIKPVCVPCLIRAVAKFIIAEYEKDAE